MAGTGDGKAVEDHKVSRPTSGAIYTAPLHCIGVGEWTPTIPPSPTCSLRCLYAVLNAQEKTGG